MDVIYELEFIGDTRFIKIKTYKDEKELFSIYYSPEEPTKGHIHGCYGSFQAFVGYADYVELVAKIINTLDNAEKPGYDLIREVLKEYNIFIKEYRY